jgi:predicted ABC-type transport system involved in lysophospholipase L1 biosynthesis ATPase subunit
VALLSFQHVSKRDTDGRREVSVLSDVSFDIDAGEYVGLWGIVRRSGKSTLLRLAAGIETPDEGAIVFDGHDLAQMDTDERAAQRRRGGIALALPGVRPTGNRPVVEHVAWPLIACRMNWDEAEGIARRMLKRVGASDIEGMSTGELGSSECVRVELARALVHEPRLLLVDEPAILASPSEARELYQLLRLLGRDKDLAVVIASREAHALEGAPRILTVDKGRVRSTDSRRKVLPFRRSGSEPSAS